jgi:Tfp pilus assembly protein PilV
MQGFNLQILARKSHRPLPDRSGFALLITITLLAFLVLLLVSLASLTRVETQVASNNQQIAQARQNALTALNIAIGELQKYAGPDQRTTARADLDATLINDTQKNGRWTGVYGSRVAADYADTPTQISSKIATAYSAASGSDAVSQSGSIVRKGSQAILLNWLVSGNESQTGFSPSSHVATDGHITLTETPVTPSSAYHKPTDTPAGEALNQVSVSPSITQTQALLVGPSTASASPGSDWVSAPLVKIQVSDNTLPGFSAGGSGSQTVGRYAWWVGDEGIKANVNLAPDSNVALLPSASPGIAFMVAQRTAIELVDGKNPVGSTAAFSTADLIGSTAFNASGTQINRALSVSQLQMINSSVWSTARPLRFHDLTSSSQSVLSDTYAGGLKKDLSSILATGASSPADSDLLLKPTPGNMPYGLPSWGKLRSYVQNTAGSSSATPLTPRLPSATDTGLYPVLTYSDIQFEYIDTASGIALAIIPRAVLWNPYNRPIKAARYEFGMTNTSGVFQLIKRVDGLPDWTTLDGPRQVSYNCETTGSGQPQFMRFIIDASEDIPPGASYTYGLTGSSVYNAPYGSKPTNILSRTTTPGYATISTGKSVAPNEYYRVKAATNISGLQFQFQGGVSVYLGLDPDLHTNYNPLPVWPPDGTVSNPWYQAYVDMGFSGSASDASRANDPSLPYLQADPDPYDDTPAATNTGVSLLTAPGTQKWGILAYLMFASRQRYLVVSNPRAEGVGAVPVGTMDGRRGKLAGFTPGYEKAEKLGSMTTSGEVSSIRNFNLVGGTPEKSILFESRSDDRPFMSIGQLQHADVSPSLYHPAYLIGNANAPSIRFTSAVDQNRPLLQTYNYDASQMATNASLRTGNSIDVQYLVNRTLWDRYFVSTIPSNGTNASGVTAIPDILPNPRHVWLPTAATLSAADKRNADTVAAHLMLKGGFNINSTSEQAWRAVLGGINQLNYSSATPDNPAGAALPRFSSPPAQVPVATGRFDWAFSGYRTLSDTQIAGLAKTIVAEIRNRGPFVSMGDFINRRLLDNPDTTAASIGNEPRSGLPFNYRESVKGTLQEAIDRTPTSGVASINNRLGKAPFDTTNYSNIDIDTTYSLADIESMRGGEYSGTVRVPPYSNLEANAPQFLTQADILSAIGPGLSARSDTFTIRTYGDAQNPVTGEITGRAWCEAVVQRTVEPVNRRSTNPADANYNETAVATAAQPDFGRRFKIISFRWLSSNDI